MPTVTDLGTNSTISVDLGWVLRIAQHITTVRVMPLGRCHYEVAVLLKPPGLELLFQTTLHSAPDTQLFLNVLQLSASAKAVQDLQALSVPRQP